jgi:hypothetical protein
MLRKGRLLWCCACVLAWLAGCCFSGRKSSKEEESGEARAGNPSSVAPWAQPSDNGKYVGYEVGGGSACHRDGPLPDEGTWGWDYEGHFIPSRVVLDWFHGKCQGGTGAYQTDGPRPKEKIERRNEE